MLDEKRVLQVAKEFSMNPDKARKLLEDARSEPAIMKRIHKYGQRVGGGSSGSQDNQGTPGQLPKNKKGDPNS